MTTLIAIIFGLIIAGIATYIGQVISKKVTGLHWIINLVLGALGAVAANQLLPGAYGPVLAGFSIIPMLAGSLVLAGIGTWCVNRLSKK